MRRSGRLIQTRNGRILRDAGFGAGDVFQAMFKSFDRPARANPTLDARHAPSGATADAGDLPHGESAAERIMVLLHDFSGGGTEQVAVRLANQWALAGRDVRIFCGSEAGPARPLVGPLVAVERARREIRRSPLSRLMLGRAAAECAGFFRPDVVFAPGNFHLPVLAQFARFDRTGAATICKISNPLVRGDWSALRRVLHGRQVRRLTARIDCLVAMSPALRADAEVLLARSNVEMCWEPIFGPADCGGPDPDRDAPPLIVAVGRLEAQKDFALAIDAMAHLSGACAARLMILGEGTQRAALEAQAARLGIAHLVSLPGHVRDVRPYLARASAFLMTSRYEGYPAALVEAIGHGVPAVTTRCSSAIPEITMRSGANLLVAADPQSVARGLLAVLSNPLPATDPMLLARHDVPRAAAAYLALLDRVRARHGNAVIRLLSLR